MKLMNLGFVCNYDEIWAAAGTPKAIFKLTPQELQKITGGRVVSVK
jgi:prolyl-tRNA editing enzyme YbaK/EbsC (Cys-tRNA(Pro) deacylase)